MNPKTIKAFIFDLDGTLFFTKKANDRSYKQATDSLGLLWNQKKYHQLFGLRFLEMIREMIPHISQEQTSQIRQLKLEYYQKNVDLIKPNKPLIQFLKYMKDQNFIICLATTASQKNVDFILQYFGLFNDFDYIVYGEDVEKGKPSPECFLKCMEKFKLSPPEVLIFEDSKSGEKAAKKCGAHYLIIKNE